MIYQSQSLNSYIHHPGTMFATRKTVLCMWITLTSYKWAGGGFISNAKDLVRFGNALLACNQLSPISPAHKVISDDLLRSLASQEGRFVKLKAMGWDGFCKMGTLK